MSKSTPPGDSPASPKPRRAYGSGSIRRRKDGRWEISFATPDGEKPRYTECLPTGGSYADAQARLDTRLAEYRAGALLTEHPTVGTVLTAWLTACERRVTPPAGSKRAPTLRPGTLRHYRVYADQYLRPRLGTVPAADLKARQVQAMLTYWETHGLAPKSVAHVLGTLRTALNYALRQEWVTRNVAAGRIFDLPYIARPPIRPFTADEARRLLLAGASTHEAALWAVLLAFGLRISEALGLTWAAWNEDTRTLAITEQLQWLDGAPSLAPLKTAQSRRTLQVPPAVVLALRGHWARQAEDRTRAGAGWQEPIPGLIFTLPDGTPWKQPTVWKHFQRLCRAADLEPRSLHSCRHSVVCLLRDQGVPIERIKEYLGHAQIATTLDIYGHATAQGQAQAVEVMARLLWETG